MPSTARRLAFRPYDRALSRARGNQRARLIVRLPTTSRVISR